MASRSARWHSNSAASASRIRTSDRSRACRLSFTRRCAASLTAWALSRTSEGSIAQRKRWARMASVRSGDTEDTHSFRSRPRRLRLFRVAVAHTTAGALGYGVILAVQEDQPSLLPCQGLGSLAVNVQQAAPVRLDDVCQCNLLRALRAVHSHERLLLCRVERP